MKHSKLWPILFFVVTVILLSFQSTSADVISIPHQACLPKQHWGESVITYYHSNGASVQPYVQSGLQTLYCPLILPQNARITKVTMEGHDHTGGEFGGYLRGSLERYKFNTATAGFAEFDTGLEEAPGDVWVTVNNIDLVIDNTEYHYGLTVGMNNPTSDSGAISFSKFIVEFEVRLIEITGPVVK